jgi:hypothetical protein
MTLRQNRLFQVLEKMMLRRTRRSILIHRILGYVEENYVMRSPIRCRLQQVLSRCSNEMAINSRVLSINMDYKKLACEDSTQHWKFLDVLRNYQIFKKVTARWKSCY